MKINVRWGTIYPEVTIEDGNTKIDLGLLGIAEREELARTFQEASEDLRVSQSEGEKHG